MWSNADAIANLATNLNDNRHYGIYLFIMDLIERKSPEPGVNRYRLFNTKTNSFITSYSGFINALSVNDTDASFPYTSGKVETDRVVGYLLTLKNIQVIFDRRSGDDIDYFFRTTQCELREPYYHLRFGLSYVNEGEPVKINDVRIVGV